MKIKLTNFSCDQALHSIIKFGFLPGIKCPQNMQSKFGDSFIVLPNTLYGEWDGALFNYQYDWTPAQKDSIRRDWIKGY